MTDALIRYGVELRAELKNDKRLVGYAAVFNQVADLRSHLEQLAPTAFRAALQSPDTDVRALFNHDPSLLLGRQGAGTLKIGTDSQGLEFEVELPDTQAGRDVKELSRRGDLTGASFGFIPDEDAWTTAGGRRLRTHTSVRSLIDVSPVTFPAYSGAGVALRAMTFDDPDHRTQLIRARARVHLGRK